VRQFGWRSFVPLGFPPLALYWAVREKMKARALIWAISAITYAVAIVASLR
jgi:hypothetical protein